MKWLLLAFATGVSSVPSPTMTRGIGIFDSQSACDDARSKLTWASVEPWGWKSFGDNYVAGLCLSVDAAPVPGISDKAYRK